MRLLTSNGVVRGEPGAPLAVVVVMGGRGALVINGVGRWRPLGSNGDRMVSNGVVMGGRWRVRGGHW